MKVNVRVWRQSGPDAQGAFEDFSGVDVLPDMSFLEMLDVINVKLEASGSEPVCFDSDCREGICGSCGAVVNGEAHGPGTRSTLCQVHMRSFKDGDTITVEPFRAKAFPVIRDLMVDRSAFDKIIQAGGFITARTGSTKRSTPPRVSAAALASPRARTRRRCCSYPPRSATSACSRRASRSAWRASKTWWRRWTRLVLARAATTASVRRLARRASRSSSSRG
jgi:succinate dehydrogenase/fumarate reductase-like Fe-S protein